MSLASPYQEHYYVADGVTTTFSFGEYFTGLSQAYVKCIIYFDDGTSCVPSFTVDMTTGFVTIVTLTKPDGTILTVPPAGSIVRVFRDTPESQDVTASQLQNYTAKQLERIFDSVVAMIQEVSYSDIHKTVRLTETQRDVAIDYLPDNKDQAVIYWDVGARKLMPAGFGQDQVVKSDGLEWLVYNQSEGKVYFIPRQGSNPIPIGKATIHNDLSGRNAPDCHPESAITGLREHLQELRDKDISLEEDIQTALNRSQDAKDTADEAKEIAQYAQNVAGEAKDIAEDAKDVAEGIDAKAQQALDNSEEALDKVTQEITDRQDADDALQDQITDNKGAIEDHIADTNNPHSVTKAQVGLGNADNTSDLDKPISTATQSALDLKMPISTKYGASLSLTIDSSTYVVTAQLKDQDNNNLGTAQTIDLPLESVVVSGSYDSDTKEVILVLESGSEIRFSVADLISGLQSEITAQNPLDADLVNDSTSAHKFVTATEKTNWNNHIGSTNNPHQVTKAQVGLGNADNTSDLNKPISTATQSALDSKVDKNAAISGATHTKITYDSKGLITGGSDITLSDVTDITATASEVNVLDGITATTTELNYVAGVTSNIQSQIDGKQATISDLATIRSGASAGKSASDTIATYGDIVTHDVNEFATAAQGAKADTALQAGDNISELVNDAGYLTQHQSLSDLGITATASEINVLDGITAATAELNYTDGVTSNIQTQLNAKQATISDLATIRSGAAAGATAVQPGDLATVATTGSYSDLSGTPTIGNATLTIQKNSVAVDAFTANATVDKSINITVPVSAADVNALPDSTKYVANASMTINNTTYVVTLQLKDQDGNNIGTAQTIDLPLESVVVGGSYDSVNKKIVLTLKDGSTIDIPVADLVAGLQSEITSTNKLDADLVDDSTSTNKFVTAGDKTTWNGKQDAISDLATIRSNASNGASAYTTIQGYGNIVTHNASEFATSAQGALADTALQSGDNVSELVNDAGYLTQHQSLSDLGITATAGEINVLDGITANTTELNYTDGVTGNIQTQLDGKQATISDLSTIRSNAQAGKSASDTIAGYGNIVTHNVAEFATSSQGAKADTAVQPGDLATVATTGSYDDLSDKPTIGNATLTIQKNSTTIDTFTANATSNKTIDIAVPTKTSDITNDSDYQNSTQVATAISTHNTSATAHSNQFNAITDKIPAEASSSNKLADKAFVNSSIATNTANFIGTFNSVAELEAYSGTVTNNDYAFVIVTDSAGNTAYDRYKYTTATTPASWEFEYELNNSSFTATQWAAINSGANTTNIGQIATNTTTISNHIGNTSNPHSVTKAQVGLGNVDNTSDLAKPISTATQTALNAKANTADLATVATSGSYNDLSDKPTIPTVNNATLTIQKNGTTVQTFTANQSTNATANIYVPTKTSDITNDSGFITNSALAPYALSADLATVATSGDYDDLSNKPTIPTVGNGTITITQGGVSKGTFTTNQSGNTTIALDAGGGGGSSTLAGLSDVTLTSPTDGQVLTYDNGNWINADPTGGYHPDLFDWKWADHEVNDMQWLRADTFSWQSGSVYQSAYSHLTDDISGKSLQSETIAGTTVQFYLADDGHKICPAAQESNVTAIYTATGVAWYYILDTVNQRFKLPRTKFGVTGLRDTVGKYVEAGLPPIPYRGINISTGWSDNGDIFTSHTGYTRKTFTDTVGGIYGNDATVQPPATQMYLYFYVGSFTQTALENTAGLDAELFNDKLDLGLGNATSTTKATIVNWGTPDYTAGVNKSWNTEYTADKAGLLVFCAWCDGGGSGIYATVNGTTLYKTSDNNPMGPGWTGGAHQAYFGGNLPVSKGDVYKLMGGSGVQVLIFFPLKGV